jgi:hypothetical protein
MWYYQIILNHCGKEIISLIEIKKLSLIKLKNNYDEYLMTIVSIDIFNYICEFLDVCSLTKMPNLDTKFEKVITNKREYILDNFPESIISIFGFENMINYPILKFNNSFIGATDYIDCIKSTDLSEPIMIGIDCYRRAFISIRTLRLNDKVGPVVDTIFQRYTNDKENWTYGCYNNGFINSSYIDTITENNIKNLLNRNKNLLYTNFYYENEDSKYYIQETILI